MEVALTKYCGVDPVAAEGREEIPKVNVSTTDVIKISRFEIKLAAVKFFGSSLKVANVPSYEVGGLR